MKKTAFWLCLVSLVALSLLPAGYLPPQAFSLWDKAQHALGFTALTGLGLWVYREQNPWRMGFGLLMLGGAIELSQAATGWRRGDWVDLLADGVGIALATGVWLLWRQKPARPD